MSTILATTPLDESSDHNRLFLAYSNSAGAGLPPWLPAFPTSREAWHDLVKPAVGVRPGARAAVVEETHDLSARLGTADDVLDKIQRARDGTTLFVVTGQQPGALGGPLLAIYKVVTAVALAERVEAILDRPCVPLYWCGADDSDFNEARSFSCLAADASPFGSAMPQSAHTAGMPTGDIDLEWPGQVWNTVKPLIDRFEKGGFVTDTINGAFDRARDNGELAAAILIGFAGGRAGVVDGRSRAVRKCAVQLITDYVDQESEVKKDIDSEGRRLEEAGYHAQLTTGDDSGVFLLEDGIRKNVAASGRPRLIQTVRRAVENCSPGVALRNLVQDHVFEPVAVVLGPAEVAYRAQLSGVYARFGIPKPAVIPRMTATYIPPPLASVLDTDDTLDIRAALTDPAGFAKQVYKRSIPKAAEAATRELHKRVNDAVDEFAKSLGEGSSARALGRIRSRLDDLKARTTQATAAVSEIGKATAIERWPFLPQLEAIVRPGAKPQERSLSSLVPFLFGGEPMTADLVAAARGYTDDLLDGRINHVVYSSK
ncbi:MAG: bacillithiol biosynthesis BshC [Candidatus Latescibacterota bacterium]|nr:MAG: bacillithiol biosynthesis BshC [Candidatus Latescibacterota bacterium]